MTAVAPPITAELRSWIVTQTEAGCRPQDVIATMRASGWPAEVATQALQEALSERLLRLHAQVHSASRASAARTLPGAPADTTTSRETADTLAQASVDRRGVAQPGPDLQDESTDRCLGGHWVQRLARLDHPRVVVFGGLLSDAECSELMALAAPRLARSETVDTSTGSSAVNAARTSDGMFFERGECALIQRLEARIADLLNWPVDHGEGLQVLRYRPGAEYRPHHDYFDPAHAGSARILERGGQRVGTLVIYLNTPRSGGATTFPDIGLSVAPVRGNAVFFGYDRPHPDTRTLHGGAPVLAGEKWVATKWLRQGVFT